MINNYLDYLCCPNCKSDLKKNSKYLICKNCLKKLKIEDGIIKTIVDLTPDATLSLNKWNKIYKNLFKNKKYIACFEDYKKKNSEKDFQQLGKIKTLNKKTVFLELGCGMFFFGINFSKKCGAVIGIDFSISALKIAKNLLNRYKIKNYLLIQANILNLPLKNNTVDFVCGNGVIEHFKNTQISINELYRILKNNGISLNTVPYLNFGSLTYRQLWGNIPDFPVLKQLAEFIHLKLLKGKHMMFGYELSFTKKKLIKLHNNAGFKQIKIEKLDVEPVFLFAPKFIRKPLRWLANNSSLFWPMVQVTATK